MVDSGMPPRRASVRLKTARKHTPSSQRWLTRQLNDPYVEAAKVKGYRSRAAFKLVELDDKYQLIGKSSRVIDLGAAPGGWSQIALERGASRVIGIDLLPIEPVSGAEFILGDFMTPGMDDALAAKLDGAADLVLSDMAPNTTGHVATDHLRIIALADLALDFAIRNLAHGGAFVTKLFQGGAQADTLATLKRHFREVRHAKPKASRKDSRELYVVAMGFRSQA